MIMQALPYLDGWPALPELWVLVTVGNAAFTEWNLYQRTARSTDLRSLACSHPSP
jgi:hypothetical protein